VFVANNSNSFSNFNGYESPHYPPSNGVQLPTFPVPASLTPTNPLRFSALGLTPPQLNSFFSNVGNDCYSHLQATSGATSSINQQPAIPSRFAVETFSQICRSALGKGLGMTGAHALERLGLTVVGVHPVGRALSLIVPWLLEIYASAELKAGLGYVEPDPSGTYRPSHATSVASPYLLWNHVQPYVKSLLMKHGPFVQTFGALGTTGAYSAARDIVENIDSALRQYFGYTGAVPKPRPHVNAQATASTAGAMARFLPELARQATLHPDMLTTYPGHEAIRKFLERTWPGLAPALTVLWANNLREYVDAQKQGAA
jgi:hypothetical protein